MTYPCGHSDFDGLDHVKCSGPVPMAVLTVTPSSKPASKPQQKGSTNK